MRYGVRSERELGRGDEADSCIWLLRSLAPGGVEVRRLRTLLLQVLGTLRPSTRAMATGRVAGGGASCLQGAFFDERARKWLQTQEMPKFCRSQASGSMP
jgi:hypothetical protein